MIMYEQDPDVLRWGLHLLHGHSDPYQNSGYCVNTTQNDNCYYDREYAREEASGLAPENEEHAQTSVFTQDWYGSTMRNFVSDNEGGQEDADDMGSSSCSSPDQLYDGDGCLLELADDFSTVDEVGKRLNQVAPTPHKPRINREIPSADEAISDHQRLLERYMNWWSVRCREMATASSEHCLINFTVLLSTTSLSDSRSLTSLNPIERSTRGMYPWPMMNI